LDLSGTCLAINKTAANRLGTTVEKILGKNMYAFIPADLAEGRNTELAKVVETRSPVRFKDVRGGRVIDQVVNPTFDDRGSVNGIAVFAMDVTEARQAQKALEESERRFRGIFEQAAVGMARVNLEGHLIQTNRTLCQMLGYSMQEMMGLHFSEVTHPEDLGSDIALYRKVLAGEMDSYAIDKRYVCKDGNILWGRLTVTRVHADFAGADYLVFVVEDITWRKKMEQELREGRAFVDNVFASIKDGISVMDTDLTILRVNPTMEAWYAHAMPLVGKKCHEAYRSSDRACEICATSMALSTCELSTEEVPLLGKEGVVSGWLEKSTFPMKDPDTGALKGVIEYVRDVSERKRVQDALRERTQELEMANKELEEFAFVASHDLKEPLRKISNFTGLLEKRYRGKLDEKGDAYIHYVVDGAARMERLIDDLLTYSRIGRDSLFFESVPLETVLGQTLEDLQQGLQEAHARVAHDPLPVVRGSRPHLGQVFQNLIANAVKFRGDAPPRITISAKRKGSEWVISVRDQGIGFDQVQRDRIFEIFQRLHTRVEYPGTGIGLAVCKKIVEMHGGRIWAESEPGKGSVFYFTLPEEGESER